MTLDWPGCTNARDAGDMPTVDGARIRPGALLRSDHHARLTPAAVEAIRATGVSRIIDLRWKGECAEQPSPFAADPIYRNIPLFGDTIDYDFGPESYGPMLDHNRPRIAAAFTAVAEAPPGPVLVHCHSGRDRTGVIIALTLTAAGASFDEVAADYARTPATDPTTMLNTLHHTMRTYGGPAAYLLTSGATPTHLQSVRHRLRTTN